MYVTTDEVYGTAGISSTEVSESVVKQNIIEASTYIDKKTFTTYLSNKESGMVSSATATTLVDSTIDFSSYTNTDKYYVRIIAGVGEGQVRLVKKIVLNTLTVKSWDTIPDVTSEYEFFWSGQSPIIDKSIDGSGLDYQYMTRIPIVDVITLSVNGTSVTPSSVYIYSDEGKLLLGPTSELSYFIKKPQSVSINYLFGVEDIPHDVLAAVRTYAAMKTLVNQMGGTFNTPSTYSLPEGSVSIGQAYVNIKSTIDGLSKMFESLKSGLKRYPYVGF